MMGTNYYWITGGTCPTCGNWDSEQELHIGKSSAGWVFGLHVIPERGLNDWQEWYEMMQANEGEIRDDYGRRITLKELNSIVTERSRPQGHDLTPAWLEQNGAVSGPCGLARHRVDHRHCIGHGEGTWDLIAGEFS